MARAGEHHACEAAAHTALDGVELGEGTVWVAVTLDREHRQLDAGQVLLDVPVTELRIEPGAVPAEERSLYVGVVAGEPGAQLPVEELFLGLGDGANREFSTNTWGASRAKPRTQPARTGLPAWIRAIDAPSL